MKLAIITLDKDDLVRYAENLMRALIETLDMGESITHTEIVIETHLKVTDLLNKFSTQDLVIFYNPVDSSVSIAEKCRDYAGARPDACTCYISSCQHNNSDIVRGKKAHIFGIENHQNIAEQIKNKFLVNIVRNAMGGH